MNARNCQPDEFFTERQIKRLSELMERFREKRDNNESLSAEEKVELEHLINAELEGSARRAERLLERKQKQNGMAFDN